MIDLHFNNCVENPSVNFDHMDIKCDGGGADKKSTAARDWSVDEQWLKWQSVAGGAQAETP